MNDLLAEALKSAPPNALGAEPVDARPVDARERPHPWLLLCGVLAVVAACYAPVLGAPFVWDDEHLIATPLVHKLQPIPRYFVESFWQQDNVSVVRAYYRPLSVLSLAIDQRVYGGNPSGFHLTNLLAHLVTTGLLFGLLRSGGLRGTWAALGSALWALSPRLTEAAAWVSGRTDMLAGCLVLAALLVRRSAWRFAREASALFLLFGLFSKETALAGVLAVGVAEWRGPSRTRARRLAPVFVISMLYAALRLNALGFASGTSSAFPLPLARRLPAVAEAIGRYAWMLVTPWLPDVQMGRLQVRAFGFVSVGALVGVALIALLWRRRQWLTASGAEYAVLTLSAFGLALYAIPFSVSAVAADRFLYLPLAGIVLLLAPHLQRFAARSRAALVLALLAVASFGAASFFRVQEWSSEVAFWSANLRRHPEEPSMSSVELGRLYSKQGLFDHAFALLTAAAQLGMAQARLARSDIGSTLLQLGRYQESNAIFQTLAREHPNSVTAQVNLAHAQCFLGDFANAQRALDRALWLAPADPDARNLFDHLPDIARTRPSLDAIAADPPSFARAHLRASVGLNAEALSDFHQMLAAPNATAAQAEEATWLALREGDAATIEDFFNRYQALSQGHADPQLQLAYDAHRASVEELERAWPGLGVQQR